MDDVVKAVPKVGAIGKLDQSWSGGVHIAELIQHDVRDHPGEIRRHELSAKHTGRIGRAIGQGITALARSTIVLGCRVGTDGRTAISSGECHIPIRTHGTETGRGHHRVEPSHLEGAQTLALSADVDRDHISIRRQIGGMDDVVKAVPKVGAIGKLDPSRSGGVHIAELIHHDVRDHPGEIRRHKLSASHAGRIGRAIGQGITALARSTIVLGCRVGATRIVAFKENLDRCNSASIAGLIVHLSCRQRGVAIGIQVDREVLRTGIRSNVVNYIDGHDLSGHVSVDVRDADLHFICANILAIHIFHGQGKRLQTTVVVSIGPDWPFAVIPDAGIAQHHVHRY